MYSVMSNGSRIQRELLVLRHSLLFVPRAVALLLGPLFCGLAVGDEPGRKSETPGAGAWAEIQVVDAANGRGVPLVELETVNGLKFVTDNAGRVAFHEPGLMGREVFFTVRSHGYEMAKDGFGFAGVRITPR